jgi:uncharacterized protein YndB with AHSA1/START domain
MTQDRIERDIAIDAPVERVWAALTEASQIAGWFGDRAEIDLRPGGAAEFFWEAFGSFHAIIERVEPHRHFAYRWARNANEPPRAGNSTLVEFTLSPEGTGTLLKVVETGFQFLEMPEEEQARQREMNTQGWHSELDELRDYAQRQAA